MLDRNFYLQSALVCRINSAANPQEVQHWCVSQKKSDFLMETVKLWNDYILTWKALKREQLKVSSTNNSETRTVKQTGSC